MSRTQWEDMPEKVRAEVEAHLGGVVKAETVEGGIMPGMACRLHLEDSPSVFLKAIQATHPGAMLHRREAWAARALPERAPAPRLLWRGDVGGWLWMAFEFVNDNARHADLSPGSPDLPAVLDTIAGLGDMLTPAPNGAVPVIDNIRPLQSKGRHLLDKPAGVLPDRGVFVAALERFDPGMVRGDTLLHYDLSAGNLLVGRRTWVLDWSFACRGAAWVDAALFAPRLVDAGHTPEAVDGMLSRVPSWRSAPRDALAGLAALWTMFRLYKALYGPENVRDARARAAVAGRAWLDYLTA